MWNVRNLRRFLNRLLFDAGKWTGSEGEGGETGGALRIGVVNRLRGMVSKLFLRLLGL